MNESMTSIIRYYGSVLVLSRLVPLKYYGFCKQWGYQIGENSSVWLKCLPNLILVLIKESSPLVLILKFQKKLIIFLLFNPSSHIFLLKSWIENCHLNKLSTASSVCQRTRDQELFLELWTIPHFHQHCMGKAICNWGLTLWASETRYIPVCSLKKKE